MGTLVYDTRLLRQIAGVDPYKEPILAPGDIRIPSYTPVPEFVTASEISKTWEPVYNELGDQIGAMPIARAEETSVLLEAENVVNGERQAAYGHPYHNFRDISQFWTTYLCGKYGMHFDLSGFVLTPDDVGNMMILMKVSRELHQHKRDNLVDIAGYAETINKVMNYPDNSELEY